LEVNQAGAGTLSRLQFGLKMNQATLCILAPCYNEEEVLPLFVERLQSVLREIPGFQFEILFVDDGSSDRTVDVLDQLRQSDNRIGFLSLSRNFGHDHDGL
jgi:glycosyltransferase involved in cell wall biosynthesis